jgi:hypothetical protein
MISPETSPRPGGDDGLDVLVVVVIVVIVRLIVFAVIIIGFLSLCEGRSFLDISASSIPGCTPYIGIPYSHAGKASGVVS